MASALVLVLLIRALGLNNSMKAEFASKVYETNALIWSNDVPEHDATAKHIS
ncbi:hypothetical protein BAUCODRAFT_29769 [Baudoinia panamericana UAMH 10762]|uniref:Uncharacterized protein n=1 Tax=Baudoinia panamericana (strain UAMH 10762) TaxID=717646 RepID=M2NJW3_BAUPA|nr:uncharacterized protein BAUCODRAFT_29769 [Baudoinia panamericana UAMH 10762]EMC99425.1 hypothetical protein BAUCODRAFT_29769 [Baudoinia panamericana UAMH 10762]